MVYITQESITLSSSQSSTTTAISAWMKWSIMIKSLPQTKSWLMSWYEEWCTRRWEDKPMSTWMALILFLGKRTMWRTKSDDVRQRQGMMTSWQSLSLYLLVSEKVTSLFGGKNCLLAIGWARFPYVSGNLEVKEINTEKKLVNMKEYKAVLKHCSIVTDWLTNWQRKGLTD